MPLSRTKLLLGDDAVETLRQKRVAVFGVGGVGGYAVEALARSGVGAIDLIDNDIVSPSNLNRQIIATIDTIGRYKTEVAKERIRSIAPACKVTEHCVFVLPETIGEIDFSKFDYVIDAIDTVSGKLSIIERAHTFSVPVISAMGAGNKLDPTAFEVCDISQTSVCPLARVMRRELKRRNIGHLKVVYSREPPLPVTIEENGKRIAGSVAFVPSVVGLIAAGEAIKDLIATKKEKL